MIGGRRHIFHADGYRAGHDHGGERGEADGMSKRRTFRGKELKPTADAIAIGRVVEDEDEVVRFEMHRNGAMAFGVSLPPHLAGFVAARLLRSISTEEWKQGQEYAKRFEEDTTP